MDGLKQKMEKEVASFVLKYFLIAPKYLYSIDEESIGNLLSDILERMFNLYRYFIEQQNNMDKIRIYSKMQLSLGKIKQIKQEILKEFPSLLKEGKNELKKTIPWYLKVLFPILSPIYYILGPPLIKIFSGKITDKIMKEIWPDIFEDFFSEYFKSIIKVFNKAINDLNLISQKFENIYSENMY